MDTTASSPDLLTALRAALAERDEAADAFDVFTQDAVLAPAPDVEPAVTSTDIADVAADAVATVSRKVTALLAAASDDAVQAAYRQSGGAVGDPAAEALLGELKSRRLDA